jgi:hypothetical protein
MYTLLFGKDAMAQAGSNDMLPPIKILPDVFKSAPQPEGWRYINK